MHDTATIAPLMYQHFDKRKTWKYFYDCLRNLINPHWERAPHRFPTSSAPWAQETLARQAISLSYIPSDRIRRFPQSSLKLLLTRSFREHLNIQFHSFLNLDRGGYLLLSQAFCVGGRGVAEGAFVFHLQEDDQQERKKCNESGTTGVPWNALKKEKKKHPTLQPFKLNHEDACFSSQQLLRDLWSTCQSDYRWKTITTPVCVSYSSL